MLAQDVADVARVAADLLHGLDGLRVGHAISEHAHQRHEEHGDGSGGHQHAGRLLRHGVCAHGYRGHRHDDGQRRGAVQGDGQAVVRGDAARVLAGGECDEYGHGADEQEQHDEPDQHHRLLEHGHEVDLRARGDEEHGNEEAVRHAVQLMLQRVIALGNDVAQHEPGGERAQHDVEVERRGERHQPHQQQHGDAHHGLGGAFRVLGEEVEQLVPGLLRLRGNDGRHHAQGDEREQDENGLPFRARGQEQRHGQHRAQLAPGAVSEDGFAHLRSHEPALLQDGHERAQRRRGQRDGDGNRLELVGKQAAGEMHEEERQDDGYAPGCQPALALAPGEALRIDLVAG